MVQSRYTNGVAEVRQVNAYYPFGMNIRTLSDNFGANGNEYLYQGKELDNELGLN
jgi:hypothetical protein